MNMGVAPDFPLLALGLGPGQRCCRIGHETTAMAASEIPAGAG
jgi:hypothetical protein